MITTRSHRLAPAEVVIEDDGSVVVRANDLVVREYTSGRMKGTIEHTVLRFCFADKAALVQWLEQCRDQVEAPDRWADIDAATAHGRDSEGNAIVTRVPKV